MDKLENRKASRKARVDNGGEQVPTQTTPDPRGTGDHTEFAKPTDLHKLLAQSAEIDVKVADDNAQKKQAEAISAAINAPLKQAKQDETAKQDAATAATSAQAEETARQQSQQKQATGEPQSGTAKGAAAGNGNGGWTSNVAGGAQAVNGTSNPSGVVAGQTVETGKGKPKGK